MKNKLILFSFLSVPLIIPVAHSQHAVKPQLPQAPTDHTPIATPTPHVMPMPKASARDAEDTRLATLTDHEAAVFNLGGDVKIQRQGQGRWFPLHKDHVLAPGDRIKTGKDS